MKLLNLLEFLSNTKYNFKNFQIIFKKIFNSKIDKFPYNGEYLIKRGIKEGPVLGKVIKMLENEWVENNFKISEKRVQDVIKQNIF